MSELVEVEFKGNVQDQATLLLAAAADLDLDPSVVRTTEGKFLAPDEVVKKAFPPKKAAAKKTAKKS